jgi:hypothetical protein
MEVDGTSASFALTGTGMRRRLPLNERQRQRPTSAHRNVLWLYFPALDAALFIGNLFIVTARKTFDTRLSLQHTLSPSNRREALAL